jgi:hypothetical protein
MNGAELIAAERQRQIDVEGWTPEHDDLHSAGELQQAARCYMSSRAGTYFLDHVPSSWPWDYDWWKPSDDPIRNLTKAGALIAAEIDRLNRLRHPIMERVDE